MKSMESSNGTASLHRLEAECLELCKAMDVANLYEYSTYIAEIPASTAQHDLSGYFARLLDVREKLEIRLAEILCEERQKVADAEVRCNQTYAKSTISRSSQGANNRLIRRQHELPRLWKKLCTNPRAYFSDSRFFFLRWFRVFFP